MISKRSRRAFTLVETLIALLILTIAIPPMLWSISQAHYTRVDPVLTSRARWLASEKLEAIIADRHSPNRGYAHLTAANYLAETPIATDTTFDRSVAFTETLADLTTASAGGGYMKAAVSVSWDDSKGDAQTLTITTVLTDYTP